MSEDDHTEGLRPGGAAFEGLRELFNIVKGNLDAVVREQKVMNHTLSERGPIIRRLESDLKRVDDAIHRGNGQLSLIDKLAKMQARIDKMEAEQESARAKANEKKAESAARVNAKKDIVISRNQMIVAIVIGLVGAIVQVLLAILG